MIIGDKGWLVYVLRNGRVLAFVILSFIVAILVGGCSGMPTTSPAPQINNSTSATVMPVPQAGGVNNSTTSAAGHYNAIHPLIVSDQAIDSVRAFLENSSAIVNCEGLVNDYYFPMYLLASDGNLFLVNAWNGEVVYANFNSVFPGNFEQGTVVDIENGRSIAAAFVSEHFAEFETRANMSYLGSGLYQDGYGGYFYQYEWREVADNEKRLNDVVVTIGVGSGKVRTYQQIHVPAGAEADFTITKGDAVLIVVSSVGNITKNFTLSSDPAQWSFNVLYRFAVPDQNGNLYGSYLLSIADVHPVLFMDEKLRQHVVWDVSMSMRREARANETYAFGETLFYRIDVDAGTGTVLRTVHSRSMGPANWPE